MDVYSSVRFATHFQVTDPAVILVIHRAMLKEQDREGAEKVWESLGEEVMTAWHALVTAPNSIDNLNDLRTYTHISILPVVSYYNVITYHS